MLRNILRLLGMRHDYAVFGIITKDGTDTEFHAFVYDQPSLRSTMECVRKSDIWHVGESYTVTDVKRF